MIHLDTSFLIAAARAGSPEDELLRTWVHNNLEIVMSAVAWMEFLCGPLDRQQRAITARIVGEPLSFRAGDAVRAAEYFNATGRRRQSGFDCMIAAAAVNAGAALATSNPADFDRFDGLEVLGP